MRPYTLGIDLHKRSSVWVLLDGEGNEVWKDSVPCHPDHITKTLKWMPAPGSDVQAALEPTCGWRWVAALLEEAGVEVHPANVNKVRLIAESTQKHDLETPAPSPICSAWDTCPKATASRTPFTAFASPCVTARIWCGFG